MPALNRNHASRLKQVEKQLEAALDKLHQAQGALWPSPLRDIGKKVSEAVQLITSAAGDVDSRLMGDNGERLTDDAPDEPGEPIEPETPMTAAQSEDVVVPTRRRRAPSNGNG